VVGASIKAGWISALILGLLVPWGPLPGNAAQPFATPSEAAIGSDTITNLTQLIAALSMEERLCSRVRLEGVNACAPACAWRELSAPPTGLAWVW
jgi:hypothetical protein